MREVLNISKNANLMCVPVILILVVLFRENQLISEIRSSGSSSNVP